MRLRLILLVGLILGMSASGHAMTYFTTTSTGICISTGGGYNLVEVRTSTPLDNSGSARIIFIDSNALSMGQYSFERADRPGVKISTQNFQLAQFTAGQYIIPPATLVVAASTSPATGITSYPAYVNPQPNVFKIGEPYGYTVREGTVILIEGTGGALIYTTIGLEQAPTGGYYRQR